MNKKLKIFLIVIIAVIVVFVVALSTFLLTNHIFNKQIIEKVIDTYSEDKLQERLEEASTDKESNLALEIDGETVIGVIRIDAINFEGLIYEGTSDSTLEKGVGHIESSAYLEGNVGLAAHNTKKFWAKLYTLKKGDTISYISFLGSKEYVVDNIQIINEKDWSLLENTSENKLTLITCILNNPNQRLCVQASEC